jgi:nitrite reductase (NADH) small subunit/3-phenylpropionate/trans-cinnamate dioxygenase ferredoxin subunit
MEYIKIAKETDFTEATQKTYRIMGRPVAVLRQVDGSFRAMQFGCKHENADLSGGHVKNGIVTCPWHGWKYDLNTGECVHGAEGRLRNFAVKVEEGTIFISLHPVD